jgi:DNA-binding transcriptional regulator YiaG
MTPFRIEQPAAHGNHAAAIHNKGGIMSDVRQRYLDGKNKPTAPIVPIAPTAPTTPERSPNGRRMTRKDAPRPRKKPEETAIFQAAAELLKITPKAYAPIFGVTRQTVSKWLHGITAPKPGAFVILVKLLVEHENTVESMGKQLEEHEERLTVALMQAAEIRAQLKEIKHDVFAGGQDK